MKEVLAFIEKKKQEFSQVPFMKFLQDKSIEPRQRLAWAPAFAFFAMSFKDVNRTVLRKEPATSKLQEMINQHTYYLKIVEFLFLDISDSLIVLFKNISVLMNEIDNSR
jgi:hypothetical protein